MPKLKDVFSNDVESLKLIYNAQGTTFVPKLLLARIYGIGCHVKDYQDFFNSEKILNLLKKNKAELLEVHETKSFNKSDITYKDTEKSFLYFYKHNMVRVIIEEDISFENNKKEKCTLTFYTPIDKECVDVEFLDFILTKNEPNIYILNNQYGEFIFSKFSVQLPKPYDLNLNYGDGFEDISKKIANSLNTNHSGLYMFHGPPGTGKSTYIKYLSSILNKDVIFFPTGLVHNITNPEIINLLVKKQNCVLVLEDAEKAIIKRESSSEASLVSALLNITDGILGDVLKINVIVTYNCSRTEIDEALLRRGRLKADYSFEPLPKESVERLTKALKLDIDVKGEMTLADIYNYKKDEELIKGIKKLEKPKIGF